MELGKSEAPTVSAEKQLEIATSTFNRLCPFCFRVYPPLLEVRPLHPAVCNFNGMARTIDLSFVYETLDALLAEPPPLLNDSLLPLLLEHLSSRSDHRQKRRATVLELEQSLEAIELAQQKLSSLRTKVKSWRGRLMWSLSPVSSLPIEILKRVLDLSLFDDRETSSRVVAWEDSLRLSQVSAEWRRVCLGYPKLWTYLMIDPWQQKFLLDSFVSRLGRLKMHLEVNCVYRATHDDPTPLFHLSPTPAAVNGLASLRLYNEQAQSCFSRSLCEGVSHGLEEITFVKYEVVLGGFEQNVQTLNFTRCTVRRQQHAPILTFPLVERLSFEKMSFVDTIIILKDRVMPRLKDLTLTIIRAPEDNTNSTYEREARRTAFQELESLAINSCYESIWSHFCSYSAPKLRKLVITVHHFWNAGELAENLSLFVRAAFLRQWLTATLTTNLHSQGPCIVRTRAHSASAHQQLTGNPHTVADWRPWTHALPPTPVPSR